MSKIETLESLLEHNLKDIYSAEKQLLKALPKMAEAASSQKLRDVFLKHEKETERQVARLEKIASLTDIKLNGKKCKGMEGLIEEGKEAIEAQGSPPLIDAGLIIAAQKAEHYEIAAYGSTRALAECLGLSEVVDLLQETLDEEFAADAKLSTISTDMLLPEAEQDGSSAMHAS